MRMTRTSKAVVLFCAGILGLTLLLVSVSDPPPKRPGPFHRTGSYYSLAPSPPEPCRWYQFGCEAKRAEQRRSTAEAYRIMRENMAEREREIQESRDKREAERRRLEAERRQREADLRAMELDYFLYRERMKAMQRGEYY